MLTDDFFACLGCLRLNVGELLREWWGQGLCIYNPPDEGVLFSRLCLYLVLTAYLCFNFLWIYLKREKFNSEYMASASLLYGYNVSHMMGLCFIC